MAGASDTPSGQAHPQQERGRQLGRVNAFSDGLFTIAATLLVLSLKVPSIPEARVPAELPHALATLFGGPVPTYFLSFAVIGMFWLRHHELFGRLARSDSRFAALNLVFLAFVALLPFPTELLGRYGHQPTVVALYAGNLLVLSLLLRWLGHDAQARRLLHPGLGAFDRLPGARGAVAVTAFAVSIPLAWVNTRVAIACWFVALLLPRLIVRRLDS